MGYSRSRDSAGARAAWMSLHRDAGVPGTLPLSFLHRLLCGASPKQWAQSTCLKESLCRCLTTGAGLPRDKARVAAQRGRGSGRGYEFRDNTGSGVGAGDFAGDGDSECL